MFCRLVNILCEPSSFQSYGSTIDINSPKTSVALLGWGRTFYLRHVPISSQ